MSFNENGQNENQNWKIQNKNPQQNHSNIDSYIQSAGATISDGNKSGVGNKALNNVDTGDENVRPGVTTFRTDFSGLFTGKPS